MESKTEQLEETKEAAIVCLERKLGKQSETIDAQDGLLGKLRERLRVDEGKASGEANSLKEYLTTTASNLGVADE